MTYLTHLGYWQVEKIFEEGRISRAIADEAHKHHKIISDATREHYAAENKMMKSIRALNEMKVKDI